MNKSINFTKSRYLLVTISVVLILGSLAGTFFQGGFNLGIDFKAGLNQQVLISSADAAEISAVKTALTGIDGVLVQKAGDSVGQYVIRAGAEEGNSSQVMADQILKALETVFGKGSVSVLSSEFVGPRFAGTLASQTLLLTLITLFLILVYVWFRFKLEYAVSAIVAIFHDVLFILGFIGILQLEFSTATIAAVLTIIGYSLNDTVVIFVRIRENSRMIKDKTFEEIVNISINQSLSRTLITSLTTFIAVLSIFIFGSGAIRLFALNLMVGVIVGTYSSIYIASTVLLGWHNAKSRKIKAKLHAPKAVSTSAKAAPVAQKNDEPVVKQSAEEIAEATALKAKKKAKKKKK